MKPRCILAIGLATLAVAASAESPYAVRTDGQIWLNGFGECWHSGTWSTEQAVSPCDGVRPPVITPRAAEPVAAPAPVQAAAPTPQPAPQPAPQKERLTLSSDLLFEFNSAVLKEAGKQRLDQLAERLRAADEINIVGFADRLGSAQYNQRLSEQRALAVKQYLMKSANAQAVHTAGKGSMDPVTGESCSKRLNRRQMIECLQPDRRVELEIYGPRTLAGTEGNASTGAPAARPVSNR